jgi:hypothetical protein
LLSPLVGNYCLNIIMRKVEIIQEVFNPGGYLQVNWELPCRNIIVSPGFNRLDVLGGGGADAVEVGEDPYGGRVFPGRGSPGKGAIQHGLTTLE